MIRPACTFFPMRIFSSRREASDSGLEMETVIFLHVGKRDKLHRMPRADRRGELGEVHAAGAARDRYRRVAWHVERVERHE